MIINELLMGLLETLVIVMNECGEFSNTLHALNQLSIMSMEIIWFYQFI